MVITSDFPYLSLHPIFLSPRYPPPNLQPPQQPSRLFQVSLVTLCYLKVSHDKGRARQPGKEGLVQEESMVEMESRIEALKEEIKRAQQLRAFAALVDSQGSVPRTHKWLTDVCNTSFRISNDLFWPLRARGTHTQYARKTLVTHFFKNLKQR